MSDPTPANPPEIVKAPNRGGYLTHKANCKCYPCRARRRTEEALNGGAGAEAKQEVLDSEDPSTAIMVRPDRSPKGYVAQYIAYKATDPKITNAQIAEKLGISPSAMSRALMKGTREGWLKLHDPLEQLEYELTPLAIKGLRNLLKDEDKSAVLEYLKQVIAPTYKEAKGVSEHKQSILAIKIEYPQQNGEVIEGYKVFPTGNIVGKPNIFDTPIEGEVSKDDTVSKSEPTE